MGWLKKVWNKLFGSGSLPTVAQQISSGIKYAAPILSTVLTLLAGEEVGTETTQAAHEAQVDLALLAKLANDAHGGTLDAKAVSNAIQSLKDNLAEILAALHIKNPGLVAKITIPVNLIVAELQVILSE